jgi:hypothetical protein
MELARLHVPVSACMPQLSARTCCFNHPLVLTWHQWQLLLLLTFSSDTAS